jgi:hypothetical protein
MGATELRAHVAGHGGDLADLGIEVALAAREPRRVLAWSERHRARWLHFRPVRPTVSGKTQGALAMLRAAVGELEDVTLAGGDVRPILQRQAELERAVAAAFRLTPGGIARLAAPPPVEAIVDEVSAAGRAVVEFVADRGALHAVVVHAGRVTVHDAGSTADVSREVTALHFALRRLAHVRLPEASQRAAGESADRARAALDNQLFQSIRRRLHSAPLVVVPTGRLHGLAWGALPTLFDREFTVAPSAGLWVRARRADADRVGPLGPTVAVAGPGLPYALSEARQVADMHSSPLVLVPPASTVAAVLHAIDGASVAHLAAHGHFRSDNPLFSSISLADGPLMVYDLESLQEAPRLVVLSACDTGAAGSTGDELLGMAAALIALGSTALVASSLPVPDDDASSFMVDFHRHLALGHGPAAALALAREPRRPGRSIDVAAVAFTSWGVG